MRNKLSILVLLVAITIPQVVFAAWWNPLSWFNNWSFQKADSQTQVLENRVRELEEKLNSATAPTATTTTVSTASSTSTIKPVTTKIKQPANTINTTATTNSMASSPNTNVDKNVLFSNILQKYTDFQMDVTNKRKSVSGTSSLPTERQYAIYLDNMLTSIASDFSYLESIKYWNTRPVGVEDIYVSKLDKLKSDYVTQSRSYGVDIAQEGINVANTQQQTDAQAQETARQNSTECIQAKSAYDSIEKQIADTNVKFRGEVDAISSNGSITQYAQQGLKDNINANYNRILADLAIKEGPLMDAYYGACGIYYSTLPSSQIQIPQQTHTKCSFYNGSISCDTYNTPY